MASSDTPADATERIGTDLSHEKIASEVGLVRTRGFGKLQDVLADLPGLRRISSVVGAGTDDCEKIEDALKQAVQRLGGMGIAALEALFGMTPETRGLKVEPRRTRAAELYDYKAYEVFRTRFEPSLLMFVATYLRVLKDEQLLAERERTFAFFERALEAGLIVKDRPQGTSETEIDLANKYEMPPELPQIYHLKHHRELQAHALAWVTVVENHLVNFTVHDYESDSRVRRILRRPNRRYQLVIRRTDGHIMGFYRPPTWFRRLYRAFIIRIM